MTADNVIPLPTRPKPSRWQVYRAEGDADWFLSFEDFTVRVSAEDLDDLCADACIVADVADRLASGVLDEADALQADDPEAAQRALLSCLLDVAIDDDERAAVLRLLA